MICCDNLAFSGEVTMRRKHTLNVFRDLPDLIYRMLGQVVAMRERTDDEIATMKVRHLQPAAAHHLMVEAIRSNVLPASRLPKVIEAWEEPTHEEFAPRTALSLFSAFTEVAKAAPRGRRGKGASGSHRSFGTSSPLTETPTGAVGISTASSASRRLPSGD